MLEVSYVLYVFNFNSKENKGVELQKLIKENEATFRKHAPKGWKYLGTYFYVLGFGPFTGAYFWECSSYGDFDAMRNHADPAWVKLWEKLMELMTPEPIPAWLLREAGDTKILEPAKRPESK